MLSLRQRMWGTYQDLLQPNCGRALLQVDRHLTLRWCGRDRSAIADLVGCVAEQQTHHFCGHPNINP